MTDPFGNPETVDALGGVARQAASDLEKLVELMNRDVQATVPEMWGGDAANAFNRAWTRFSRSIAGVGSPMEAYFQWLDQAADTMRRARQQLEAAHRFAAANGLRIRPDLVVEAIDASRPGAQEAVRLGQQHVDRARRMAEEAREQIRQANATLERFGKESLQELAEILDALGGPGGRRRGGPRRRPTLGIRGDETGMRYGPEGILKLPRPSAGRWSGTIGDSVWTPHRGLEREFGLLPGQSIRFRQGVPDLREHGVPMGMMPDGRTSHLDGLGLNGDRRHDARLGDTVLAERFGWRTRTGEPDWERVRLWRRDNDYVLHHYSRTELQLVPGRVHRPLHHQGGVDEF